MINAPPTPAATSCQVLGVAASSPSASSHGEHRPAKPNDGPANRAYNQCIEIILMPDLTSLPGFEELKAAVERT